MDRVITQPIMPREIDLKLPLWYVVSDKNIDEFHERLTKEHGQVVFVAMSIPDYYEKVTDPKALNNDTSTKN